ncbi:SRPBCC domain-containing protein [Spongiactinospora sp. TRM90649]|uniref:SRPBCC domain-containing protein n=1 Tax=Spongiactinospora sp. TRM90649 TaxID=3031114 RepID=UPI0023FA2273|nr:SRPBCC domain-containing protein [Spongiactinospora sp. TRM90649]MDF5756045.1 SRPBCC domain-containing protein [Spongiactinospora sp. TRM90649]
MEKLFYRGPSLDALQAEYAFRGRIDEAAPVRSESSVIVDADPWTVWSVLADLRRWPEWTPGHRVLELGDIAPGEPFVWRLGGVKIRSRFAVVSPGRELTWTGVFLAYQAVDRQTLEPLPRGRTKVTIRESLAGPLVPLIFSSAKLRAAHESYLNALKNAVTRIPQTG